MAPSNSLSKLCVVCGRSAQFDVYQAFSRLTSEGNEFEHQQGDEFGHRYYCRQHMPAIFSRSLDRRPSHAA